MRNSLTQENYEAWQQLPPEWQLRRMREWAAMLEARVAELDPHYRAYPWGLMVWVDTSSKASPPLLPAPA